MVHSKAAGWHLSASAGAIPGVGPDTILCLAWTRNIVKPADFVRELLYPLTDMAIIMAMLFFWVAFAIAQAGGLLGLWLLILLTPAYFRYLLYLLEARASGNEAPVPTAEMFDPAENFWSLTPLILVALVIWGGIAIADFGWAWSLVYGIAILFVMPASMAILAVTHSPLESLNPAAIVRMFRVCGSDYFLVPAAVVGITLFLATLGQLGLPLFFVDLGTSYQSVLVFTLTGAILRAKGVSFELKLEDAVERSEEEIAGDLEKEREKVASHAYGFISRGNREGGFAHIMDWIQNEPDVHEASAWFFSKMMKWEVKDPALFYAQIYIAHLLHHNEEAKVLKLVSICLHENPTWKPKAEDRQHVIEIAEKFQRDDLLASLRN